MILNEVWVSVLLILVGEPEYLKVKFVPAFNFLATVALIDDRK